MAKKYVMLETRAKKSDALPFLQSKVNLIEKMGFEVRIIRTDDEQTLGRKYTLYINEKGITSERAAPYSKEQDGAAERSSQDLILKSRTMAVDSGIPTKYWPEITRVAAYIENRIPTKAIGWKTLFEEVMGKKPTVAHMRAYGCKAYALISKEKIPRLQKLDPRAYIEYLIGYDSTNIYRVLVPSQMRVIRVRDVTFKETTSTTTSPPI